MAVNVQMIEYERLKKDTARQIQYSQGVMLLKQSGIFNFLRIFARPFQRDGGANLNMAAYSAGYTEGYHQALEHLEYFEELYLANAGEGKKAPVADFGGLHLAKLRGDITDKDIETHGKKVQSTR